MKSTKAARVRAAISAAAILLAVIGAAGCDEGAAAVGAAGRAAAHDADQPSLADQIRADLQDLNSDETHAIIGNACQALGLPTPQYPSIDVDSDTVDEVENTIYEEQQADAQGANEASALCQAANM